jgi:hypothetical protein
MLIKYRVGEGGCAEIFGEELCWKIATWEHWKEVESNVEIYHRETTVENVTYTELARGVQRNNEICKMSRFHSQFCSNCALIPIEWTLNTCHKLPENFCWFGKKINGWLTQDKSRLSKEAKQKFMNVFTYR